MSDEITESWARTAPAGAELDRVCAECAGQMTLIDAMNQ